MRCSKTSFVGSCCVSGQPRGITLQHATRETNIARKLDFTGCIYLDEQACGVGVGERAGGGAQVDHACSRCACGKLD